MIYEFLFVKALLLTWVTEITVAIVLLKIVFFHKDISSVKIVSTGVLVSALTLPYFWFILPAFVTNRVLYIVGGEILIIIIEALIYRQLLLLKNKEAFAVSLLANVVSIFFGLILL